MAYIIIHGEVTINNKTHTLQLFSSLSDRTRTVGDRRFSQHHHPPEMQQSHTPHRVTHRHSTSHNQLIPAFLDYQTQGLWWRTMDLSVSLQNKNKNRCPCGSVFPCWLYHLDTVIQFFWDIEPTLTYPPMPILPQIDEIFADGSMCIGVMECVNEGQLILFLIKFPSEISMLSPFWIRLTSQEVALRRSAGNSSDVSHHVARRRNC